MTEPEPPADEDSRSVRFATAYAAAVPALLAWARLRLRPELRTVLEPEDLVQEVGCRAFASFDEFDADRGSFRQWLFGFGARVLLEAMRQAGRGRLRRVEYGATAAGITNAIAQVTTITQRVARDEVVRLFLARLDELEDGDRRLLLHRGLEGMAHAELAQLLGIGDDVLRKRWSRLCERLRSDPVFSAIAVG